MQGFIIVGSFILVFGFIGAVIYKIITAERIKAGLNGVEIETEEETKQQEVEIVDNKKRRIKG